MLMDLIWVRGRMSLKLKLPVTRRGMAAPNFEQYYIAAQMQWVMRQVSDIQGFLEEMPEPVEQLTPLVRTMWRLGRRAGTDTAEQGAFRHCW